jgi:hypothetical protein
LTRSKDYYSDDIREKITSTRNSSIRVLSQNGSSIIQEDGIEVASFVFAAITV